MEIIGFVLIYHTTNWFVHYCNRPSWASLPKRFLCWVISAVWQKQASCSMSTSGLNPSKLTKTPEVFQRLFEGLDYLSWPHHSVLLSKYNLMLEQKQATLINLPGRSHYTSSSWTWVTSLLVYGLNQLHPEKVIKSISRDALVEIDSSCVTKISQRFSRDFVTSSVNYINYNYILITTVHTCTGFTVASKWNQQHGIWPEESNILLHVEG